MDQQLLRLCQVETKSLIWVTGMMFAAILVFQYFELPYGNVLSSLFSADKVLVVRNVSISTGHSPNKSEMINNMTVLIGSNTTYAINERANNTEIFNGRERNPWDASVRDRNGGTNQSLKFDENVNAEEAREPEQSFNVKNDTTNSNFSMHKIEKDENSSTSEHIESSDAGFASPSPALPPMTSSHASSQSVVDIDSTPPVVDSNTTLLEKDRTTAPNFNENSGNLRGELIPLGDNSSLNRVTQVNKALEMPTSSVISISEMNNLLLQNRASYHSMTPQWPSAVDQELLHAKSLVENAPIIKNDPSLYAPLYRNVSMFKRSYELMEDTLKVYIYREGKKPVLHQPRLTGIYASEGWFMKLLEANQKFITKDPRKAHLFYLPFSSQMLEETLYIANSHSFDNLIKFLKNYLDLIEAKYPFWNRTGGADHFLVACHDWAPTETNQLMAKCLRALCNADAKEGFVLGKDVSLPETYVHLVKNPLRDIGGKPASQRSILAFFAGNMHGYLRPILLQHWENKDPDMKIFGRMPKSKGNKNYLRHMKRQQILNWESFAVFVLEKDIPNLKSILLSIPEKRYLQLQLRVKKVQKHFLWHAKPEKYDIFHMILHSVWYNRLHQLSPT
ncbi:hypothetical protein CMV_022020 [Castanea mollissima]|uniref:Exostosin GT47 domain-containing protein n=1 Tax=Castanea mollissima TaxID=60419 RepID=A0A8J4QMZ3_9ROSI|nr:hypothetical protein CMV_022020 [Castanea mollissima]